MMQRPVLLTDLQIASLSHGRIDTRSITSHETPSRSCAI